MTRKKQGVMDNMGSVIAGGDGINAAVSRVWISNPKAASIREVDPVAAAVGVTDGDGETVRNDRAMLSDDDSEDDDLEADANRLRKLDALQADGVVKHGGHGDVTVEGASGNPLVGVDASLAPNPIGAVKSTVSMLPEKHAAKAPSYVKPNAWASGSRKIFMNSGLGGKLEFTKPTSEKVEIKLGEAIPMRVVWGYSLLGQYVGYQPSHYLLVDMMRAWGVKARYRVEEGWMIFQFDNEQDQEKVLRGGPYFIHGKPMIMKHVHDRFAFNRRDVATIPLWVRIFGLAKTFWTPEVLGRIASHVGKPLYMDTVTDARKRGLYARVLVELNFAEEIKRSVQLEFDDGVTVECKFLIENEPKYCCDCFSFGHDGESCSFKEKKESVGVNTKRVVLNKSKGNVGSSLKVAQGKKETAGNASVGGGHVGTSKDGGKIKEVTVTSKANAEVVEVVNIVEEDPKAPKKGVERIEKNKKKKSKKDGGDVTTNMPKDLVNFVLEQVMEGESLDESSDEERSVDDDSVGSEFYGSENSLSEATMIRDEVRNDQHAKASKGSNELAGKDVSFVEVLNKKQRREAKKLAIDMRGVGSMEIPMGPHYSARTSTRNRGHNDKVSQ